jgi:hypothetical protein
VESGVGLREGVWLFASKGNYAENYTMARMCGDAELS